MTECDGTENKSFSEDSRACCAVSARVGEDLQHKVCSLGRGDRNSEHGGGAEPSKGTFASLPLHCSIAVGFALDHRH